MLRRPAGPANAIFIATPNPSSFFKYCIWNVARCVYSGILLKKSHTQHKQIAKHSTTHTVTLQYSASWKKGCCNVGRITYTMIMSEDDTLRLIGRKLILYAVLRYPARHKSTREWKKTIHFKNGAIVFSFGSRLIVPIGITVIFRNGDK